MFRKILKSTLALVENPRWVLKRLNYTNFKLSKIIVFVVFVNYRWVQSKQKAKLNLDHIFFIANILNKFIYKSGKELFYL